MIKAIIFDFDGVITDSYAVNMRLWRQIFRKFDVKITKKDCYTLNTLNTEGIAKHYFKDKKTREEFISTAINFDKAKYAKSYKPRRGLKKLLKKLKANNIKIAVVTNRGNSAPIIIKQFKLDSLMDCIITARDVKKGKPNPEGMNLAIQKLGVKQSQVFYVGDMPIDEQAAKHANISFVGMGLFIESKRKIKKLVELLDFVGVK
ncbi:HAD family phosphatase [Candidatus Woesearchaeota archaeon]|nr:HAD family phosphatase [Candidatus Woesearchaeota archaeon]